MKRHLETLFRGLDRSRYCLFLAIPDEEELTLSLGPLAEGLFRLPVGVSSAPGMIWKNICALKRIIVNERINLVHTHGYRAGMVGQPAAWMAGRIPVVATVHNFHDQRSRSFLLFKAVQTVLYNIATDRIITVSGALRDELVRMERIPGSKITVIYNGIKNEVPDQLNLISKQDLGMDPDLPVVGAVARLEEHKGISYLIEAIPFIDREFGPASYLIIGDGPQGDYLRQLAKNLGVADRVFFTGYRNDVKEMLEVMDLVVIPSLQEGLSIFCLEALAAGKPVVASRVGGLPEIIHHEETGLLVPPADNEALAKGVVQLLNNRAKAQLLAEQGKNMVEKEFTVQRMLALTREVYDNVYKEKYGVKR